MRRRIIPKFTTDCNSHNYAPLSLSFNINVCPSVCKAASQACSDQYCPDQSICSSPLLQRSCPLVSCHSKATDARFWIFCVTDSIVNIVEKPSLTVNTNTQKNFRRVTIEKKNARLHAERAGGCITIRGQQHGNRRVAQSDSTYSVTTNCYCVSPSPPSPGIHTHTYVYMYASPSTHFRQRPKRNIISEQVRGMESKRQI